MSEDSDFRKHMRRRSNRWNNVYPLPRNKRTKKRKFPLAMALMAFVAAAGITQALMNGDGAAPAGADATPVDRAPADMAPAAATAATAATAAEPTYSCFGPTVVDGDTIRCAGKRVRLSSIDAPEMPDHCRPGRRCTPGDPFASKANLQSLTRFRRVTCREVDIDHYGRSVAFCSAGGKDLSCAQVQGDFAVRRYGNLSC